MALSGGGSGRVWSEDARAVEAEVLETYAGGPLAGRPVVTRRQVGSGAAWYLGTLPDDAKLSALLSEVTAAAGVHPVLEVPSGVEAVRRRTPEASWLFVLNRTPQPCPVDVAGHDLVRQVDVTPGFVVPARNAAVIRELRAVTR